jgi:cobalt ECF transporter T component CbiQ
VTDAAPALAPDWLRRGEVGLCPCGCVGRRRKGNFVDKTLAGAARVMSDVMVGEHTARGPGLLQRLDARVKVLTFFGVLVAASFVHHATVLAGVYALTLAAAALSRLPLGRFVKRVWLFIPVFTGIVVLPATFNIVTHGHVVVPLGHWWFGRRIGLTREGLDAAALIVTRVAVSASIVVLLALTTSWPRLLAALRGVLVPRMFVQIIGMAYRYILHLLTTIEDMYAARKSRMAGGGGSARAGQSVVAASAGALLGKAHALSEEVHLAMVSRGDRGEARTLATVRATKADWLWAVGCALTVAATIGVDRVLGH